MTQSFNNPFSDSVRQRRLPDPCLMVIFGATGDLTHRKLIPALYHLAKDGQLPSHFACIGFARREKTNEFFRNEMRKAIEEYTDETIQEDVWEHFQEQIYYHRSEFDNDQGYQSLNEQLTLLDKQHNTKGNRLFYLSTPPNFFPLIIQKLNQHKLIYPYDENSETWSRVIIEKPFGHDLESAKKLQDQITEHLNENQIYRIDHYLGKETVQNLLVFRFTNSIFESLWNNRHIDHVQITVAEDLGIGTRGNFFESAGVLRDIVQNHMMQLLSLVAMEPPTSDQGDAIRNEKVKVLQCLRPFPLNNISDHLVRGQYSEGYIEGEKVIGYREEENVAKDSQVETYAAMKLWIDNWRWSGIPFFLRTGKRLAKKATEIAVFFRHPPGYLFKNKRGIIDSNVLVIRIQPDEGISLKTNCKVPRLSQVIQPVKMDFQYSSYFGLKSPDAYERLICDCMAGDNTLFARIDEVMASWKLFTPILQQTTNNNFPNYEAGSWGPKDADHLIETTGRDWRLI